jgi:ubiquinone/menaquinone biosynthesis C-methylase UbiE
MWLQFEEAVRSGAPARHAAPSEQFTTIFNEGVEAWTGLGARALPQAHDFSGHRKVLDIGGGTGSYLVPLLTRYPQLQGTLYDLPNALEVARRRLEGQPTRDRISLEEGDVLFDPLPEGHDVVLMAGFVHLFDPERVEAILNRIREVVKPGTRLLIVDQWMDATRTKPALGALLSCTYFLISGGRNTYTPDEARAWMERTGFRFQEHRPLGGPTSLVIGEAV